MSKGIVISHTFYRGIKDVDYILTIFPECPEEPYHKGKITDGEGNNLASLSVRDRAITIEESTWDKVPETLVKHLTSIGYHIYQGSIVDVCEENRDY